MAGSPLPKPAKELAPTSATKYRTLKNGAVYDLEKHRIVANPGGGLAAFDSDTARLAQAHKQELKRERVAAGANAVVAGLGSVRDGQVFAGEGLDWVQAISEQVAIKALDPDNPKQVDAFRVLVQESGLAEQRQQEQPSVQTIRYDVSPELAELLREVRQLQAGAQQQAAEQAIDANVEEE